MKVFLPLLLLSSVVRADHRNASSIVGFDYETLSTKLPTALSDFSVVLDEENGLAYLAGGCNSTDGNRFVEEYREFACESISSSLHIFDLRSLSFKTEPESLPVARYRHASVLANKQVWLVGGRDAADDLISTVDVSIFPVVWIVAYICTDMSPLYLNLCLCLMYTLGIRHCFWQLDNVRSSR